MHFFVVTVKRPFIQYFMKVIFGSSSTLTCLKKVLTGFAELDLGLRFSKILSKCDSGYSTETLFLKSIHLCILFFCFQSLLYKKWVVALVRVSPRGRFCLKNILYSSAEAPSQLDAGISIVHYATRFCLIRQGNVFPFSVHVIYTIFEQLQLFCYFISLAFI